MVLWPVDGVGTLPGAPVPPIAPPMMPGTSRVRFKAYSWLVSWSEYVDQLNKQEKNTNAPYLSALLPVTGTPPAPPTAKNKKYYQTATLFYLSNNLIKAVYYLHQLQFHSLLQSLWFLLQQHQALTRLHLTQSQFQNQVDLLGKQAILQRYQIKHMQ